jgi:RNA polymerase sigma-70 factor, ECF subfamily
MARHRAIRAAVPTADIGDLVPPTAPATEQVADAVAVREALVRLTPRQRELVHLAYFDHLTQQEIADRLGLPLGTVKSRTFEALRVLRGALAGE